MPNRKRRMTKGGQARKRRMARGGRARKRFARGGHTHDPSWDWIRHQHQTTTTNPHPSEVVVTGMPEQYNNETGMWHTMSNYPITAGQGSNWDQKGQHGHRPAAQQSRNRGGRVRRNLGGRAGSNNVGMYYTKSVNKNGNNVGQY
tara:strand:+ start:53 stop:487 length:435 start_codon:yes stop_codon:yes gene_type:complete